MASALPSAEIGLLDLADPGCVRAYERAFYEAFSRVKANQLIRDLWIWDDRDRLLRTRIPYAHQCIFVLGGADGAVKMAMAINISPDHYQASAFGFARPVHEPEASCEILTFFSTCRNKWTHLHRFLVAAAHHWPRERMRWADATCTQRLLPIYQHLGADVLASCHISNEARHHLRFNIASFSSSKSLLRPAG